MAKPELGTKRACQHCGTKFFDLSRSPIVCPKCATVFQAVALSRAAAPAAVAKDEEVEADPLAADLAPLEEADPAKAPAAAADGVEIEDDDAAEDTFLEEEEEESDDVAGLIDGEIENDEEA